MDKIKVLLADDQNLITQSFKILLETLGEDIEVVGTAADGMEVLAALERLKTDVILMDVRMPKMDGVETVKLVRERYPNVRVIMLTTFDDDNYVKAAILNGASGYLLKDISTEELLAAIRTVKQGAVLLSRKAAISMAYGGTGESAPESGLSAVLADLSPKEYEVFKLLAQGQENKEIADALCMAEQTVKNAVSRIYLKIGAENRKDARRIALGLGVFKLG